MKTKLTIVAVAVLALSLTLSSFRIASKGTASSVKSKKADKGVGFALEDRDQLR